MNPDTSKGARCGAPSTRPHRHALGTHLAAAARALTPIVAHCCLSIPHAVGATVPHRRALQREAILTLEAHIAAHRVGSQPWSVHAIFEGHRSWAAHSWEREGGMQSEAVTPEPGTGQLILLLGCLGAASQPPQHTNSQVTSVLWLSVATGWISAISTIHINSLINNHFPRLPADSGHPHPSPGVPSCL